MEGTNRTLRTRRTGRMGRCAAMLLAILCASALAVFPVVPAAAEEADFRAIVPIGVYYDPNWDAYHVDFTGTTQHDGHETVDNTYAMGKIAYTLADGTPCVAQNIYSLGTYLTAFIHKPDGSRIGTPTKGDRLTVLEGCGYLEFERTEKEFVFQYDGNAFVLQTGEPEPPTEDPTAPEYLAIVPISVNYHSGWDAYLVDFAGTTQHNIDETVDNPYAMGKITYTLADGTECAAGNIYSLGTNLAAFINKPDGSRIGPPTQGDLLTVREGCGFLENERTEQAFTFAFDGQSFVLQLTIRGAYHWAAWDVPRGSSMTVDFGPNAESPAQFAPALTGTDYIEYIDTFGQQQPIADFISINGGNMLFRIGPDFDHLLDKVRIGDRVTFKAGLQLTENNLLTSDRSFVVSALSTEGPVPLSPFVKDPDAFHLEGMTEEGECPVGTVCALTWSFDEEGIYATPRFESLTPDTASVDENGLVTFLAPGKVEIKATVGGRIEQTATTMAVTGTSRITGLEGNSYTVFTVKGERPVYPTDWQVWTVYEDGLTGPTVTLTPGENLRVDETGLDVQTVGEYQLPATVSYGGKEYDRTVTVCVHEPSDLRVSDVAVVGWFGCNIFVMYPDVATNAVNITNGQQLGLRDVTEKVTYLRADGTEAVCGYYLLTGGNFCLLPAFVDGGITEKNFNTPPYYAEGDTITLHEGLRLYRWTGDIVKVDGQDKIVPGTGMYAVDTICRKEMTYRFDGHLWSFYKEYTDLHLSKESIELEFGEKTDLGAWRVPEDASVGSIVYTPANPEIVTVNVIGTVKAVGVGQTTITITLDGGAKGKIEKVVPVTVTDRVTGLLIEPERLTVSAESEILQGIVVKPVWSSGREGEPLDLTGAEILGFDAENRTDDQTVTIAVKIGEETLSGTMLVRLTEAPTETPTETPTGTSTEAPTETPTGTPTLPSEPDESGTGAAPKKDEEGCRSALGFSGLWTLLAAGAACALSARRKRG